MAKSYVSDSNRSDGSDRHTLEADTHKGSRARSDRPGNLVFYLVTSILLHSVLFLGSDYWLRAFAPKQELSEPIPIEYVEVPPNKTNTPPKTSRRAAIDSVAGGKAKPERSISNAKPALTTVPKTSNTSTPSEVSQPEQTQQAIISSNPPPQNLQPKPQKIAIVPVTKPLAEASPTASKPKLQPPVPEASPTATKPLTLKLRQPTVTPEAIPPEPQASPTATKPTTKPLAFKLRQPTVTPEATPPEPQVSPTATKPTTKPLAFKLRQPTVTPEATPPEPQVSPTTTKPTKPLAFKLRQPPVTPEATPPEPQASPTTTKPTTKPLAFKLRQPPVTPEATASVPQASPTTTKPTTKPLAFKLRQPPVTPEATASVPQASPTTTKPTTKPLAFKLRQPTVTPEATASVPQASPTASKPTTKPLAFKLRQPTVTPEATASVPQASPTASKPTTKPLAFKLRQPTVTPEATASVPQASPTASKPTTKPLAFKLRQPTVTPEATASEAEPSPTISKPTPKLPKQQPSPTAVVPTKPLALKPQQTVVTSATTPPVPLTRRENRERLAAKSSSEQLENRMNSSVSEQTRSAVQSPAQKQPTTSRKLSGVQPSSKVGRASSLGGPIRVSNRDLGSNNLAALPNSNRLNPATQGIDARQDADIGAYVQQLQELVKLQWIPGLTQSSQRTVLVFTVSRAGLVSNLRVAQSSGFSTTDEAALSAVKRAAPFAPFPTAYTENYINIQFTFNINVYGQLELGSDDR